VYPPPVPLRALKGVVRPAPPLLLPGLLQDSGAYFLHLLWNLYSTPGYDRAALLAEPVVYEAASLLVDVWTVEQRHEEQSQYRYSELPREGRGPLVNYTGAAGGG
jgi:meiotically up-regulated gene 157 (Mug157) protein